MNTAFQIGKIMEIPIRLHITFLVIIPWVAYAFASVSTYIFGKLYGFGAVEPATLRWIYSFAFAILLFVCVALHELGHSFVARRFGIRIKSITLYLFGGVASMEEIPRNPALELRMAVAGPAVSGMIGLAAIALYWWAESLLGAAHPAAILMWTLGIMNLILMAFNLIPAFPMDGGRVLRAWFATRMPYVLATRRAASIGKAFAMLLGFLGLFSVNILTMVVAFFVYVGATEEERATTVSDSLRGIKVKHIMSGQVKTVGPEMNLRDLTDLMFREKHRGYPVIVDEKPAGIVTITDLQRVAEEKREGTLVGQVMTRDIYVIGPEEEAASAMKRMTESNIRRLPVTLDGKMVGIISREDLVRAIELCSDGR
ncbi:MAG: Zinc metalloprotease [Methanosaeta sp. PtaU1.Bin028]|nr:MAG: Zinc metalloprotease [Methanosaeta sp. PtaU1.Bin028]